MEEDTGRLSSSRPHRTPGSSAKPAGRQPHRPSRSRPSLPGRGSKRQGLASQRSDPISALPARLLGPPLPARMLIYPSSQHWGTWPSVLSLALEMLCRPGPWRLFSLLPAGASLLLVLTPSSLDRGQGRGSNGKLQETKGWPRQPQLRGCRG